MTSTFVLGIAVVLMLGCGSVLAAAAECAGGSCEDCAELHFDFESGDLQGWAIVAGKFGKLIADREWRRNTPNVRYNQQGRYYLSTTERADGGFDDTITGVIESPVFVLAGPTISFLVGGGGHSDTRVSLCMTDGCEVMSASGSNSEEMTRVVWDVGRLIGKKVFLKVVDGNTGGWGHITCDDFAARGIIDWTATKKVRGAFQAQEKRQVELARRATARNIENGSKRMRNLLSGRELTPGGKPCVYEGERLGAISLPIGGIGAGCIQMDGQAQRSIWQIFNNYSQSRLPDSFFAVRVKGPCSEPVVRALQTTPVGPFPAMQKLRFFGEYPFGWYSFSDAALPVDVRLEVFSPFIPLNLKDSSIPCGVFRITVTNTSGHRADIGILAAQQNAVGFTGKGDISGRSCSEYGGNTNRIVAEGDLTMLHMLSNRQADAPGYGDMALAAVHEDSAKACTVAGAASWDSYDALLADLSENGAVTGQSEAGPSPVGQTLNGALSAHFDLAPGETRSVAFVLTWSFPNAVHGEQGWGGVGNRYTRWWPNALETARDVQRRLPELTRLTHLYHDTLYASNLPRWLTDRISSQVAILRSRTCFWTKDGFFGAYEGCGSAAGCCLGNCNHVWHYAQAHARLFPELGRIMRDQDFACQRPDGGLPHRLTPNFEPATDGQFGAILGAYREHLMSADRGWLDRQWPAIRRAMEYAITTWDQDEDGVLGGRQWNTLDDSLGGSTSWMGTLYLASLAACESMAETQGDSAQAQRYARIRNSGQARQDETLFNGEYYVQIPDPEPHKDYITGCHIDQVLGQWWAQQLGLGWLYPREHVRTALASLLKYNLRPTFSGIGQTPRKFVADEDAGMQMITWPHGGRPGPERCINYGDEVMTGFEYSAAAAMVQAGMLTEGLAVVRAVHDRYDGRLRRGLTAGDSASWGYSGNPFGDDECGKFYARAMSVWSLLTACQGLQYDGPKDAMGFRPVWRPEDHVSFFTSAEGWGLFTQQREHGKQENSVEIRYGRLALRNLTLELPPNKTASSALAEINGNPLDAKTTFNDGILTLSFPEAVELRGGDSLSVTIGLR